MNLFFNFLYKAIFQVEEQAQVIKSYWNTINFVAQSFAI